MQKRKSVYALFCVVTFVAIFCAKGVCAQDASCIQLPGGATVEPVSERGQLLTAYLDSLDVENHWLPQDAESPQHTMVNWITGDLTCSTTTPNKGDTFCSSFVSAVVHRAYPDYKEAGDIEFLHPYDHTKPEEELGTCAKRDYLSNYQQDWLSGKSVPLASGYRPQDLPANRWNRVHDVITAQNLANKGCIVIASYKYDAQSEEGQKPGHIVVIRPREIPLDTLSCHGPQVISAGASNHQSTSLKQAFRVHSCWYHQQVGDADTSPYCPVGAWESLVSGGSEIMFFTNYHSCAGVAVPATWLLESSSQDNVLRKWGKD